MTITAAISTPIKIQSSDLAKDKPKILAANEPVHPPVPGNGIPTNIAKPISSYRYTTLPLFRVRLYIQSVNFLPHLYLETTLKNHSKKSNKKGIGSIFPRMESVTAFCQGIPKTAIATGMEPLSSTTGKVDMSITIKEGFQPFALRLAAVLSP